MQCMMQHKKENWNVIFDDAIIFLFYIFFFFYAIHIHLRRSFLFEKEFEFNGAYIYDNTIFIYGI